MPCTLTLMCVTNDTWVILSICIAVYDFTCIKSLREFSKFIRLKQIEVHY